MQEQYKNSQAESSPFICMNEYWQAWEMLGDVKSGKCQRYECGVWVSPQCSNCVCVKRQEEREGINASLQITFIN